MAPTKRTAKTKARQNNLKVAKLTALLEDFDDEVETIAKQLKEKRIHLLNSLDKSYDMAIIKLPRAVRKMNWLANCKSENILLSLVDDTKGKEEAANVESVLSAEHNIGRKSVKNTTKKRAGAKSSAEDETPSQNPVKKRTTRKPPTTSKKAKALSVNTQNSSIRRSQRKGLVTPARNMMETSLLMGHTPLITPRFDPRLPMTPALREPRHKERIYSISVNGSPIKDKSEDIVMNIPVGNGESVRLLASQIDSSDLSVLDDNALKSIRRLQMHLTKLCGTAE